MCGICGVYSFSGQKNFSAPYLEEALQTLNKRGPEVQASIHDENVILGHTRLSIIDVSEAANQPFTDESGNYSIVFNGEIYNFKSLRDILIAKGYSFRTHSDTEVLLKWLIEKGPEGINDLQGFFAFGYYNKSGRSLLLARDRFGKKPLYYHIGNEQILFASEMKALLRMGIPREIDNSSLFIYFQLNYIPAPWSIYKEVLKLEPGHYMEIASDTIEKKQYYAIPEQPWGQYSALTYPKAQELLWQKMEESVLKRLVADVPLGAFLSGGIDSSIIVALAARHVNGLKTFSIGFRDEPMFDETHYAHSVAKMHKTDHQTFSLTTNDLLGCIWDVLDYTDEPFADSSALAVNILSRETKKFVTVALSGDGADEMFGGYNKHMAHLKAQNAGFAAMLLKEFHPLLSVFPQSRNTKTGNKVRQLVRFGQGMKMTETDRYWRWASYTGEDYPMGLLKASGDIREYKKRKQELTSYVRDGIGMNSILLNDMKLVLPNDMLTKVDMMSMANSLEVRVPFLDHEVVDLVFSLPAHFKIDNSMRKKILKDTFRDLLPPELYTRPKQGFEVPLLSWFRKELRETIIKNWLDDQLIEQQGVFNGKVINNLKNKLFSSNPGEIHAQIWAIGVFQHWYSKFHSTK